MEPLSIRASRQPLLALDSREEAERGLAITKGKAIGRFSSLISEGRLN